MDLLDINELVGRTDVEAQIKSILQEFERTKTSLVSNRGIYIYGNPGIGKTTFVANVVKKLNYDMIKYNAGDIRNSSVIDDISKCNMSDKNVLSMLNRQPRKLVIVMDEIDGMNNGDKGGITALIKLIRPKKTKKQKAEEFTLNPIICIGNYKTDKKIKELMKVCEVIELTAPTNDHIRNIVCKLFYTGDEAMTRLIINYVQNDLRKLATIYNVYANNPTLFASSVFERVLQLKSSNDDTKRLTCELINKRHKISDHNMINDADRTSVSLLWHENIIDFIDKKNKMQSVDEYLAQLKNICFADYVDRNTFQKQIWQLNELSSLIKTFYNNKLHHDSNNKSKRKVCKPSDIRFTKVLTKYSTEFNNITFIQKMCQKFGMDKKDLIGFFIETKTRHPQMNSAEMVRIVEYADVGKLDVNRMYRYIEKYTCENACGVPDVEVDVDADADVDADIELDATTI